MLVGNILLVTPQEVWKTFALFLGVGAFHFFTRRNFLMVTFAPEKAQSEGISVKLWDFLFYATFGLVVTSFVRIVGVLLVFTYLIVPAVCGVLLARSFGMRLLLGCLLALLGGIAGLWVSFSYDLPSGAAIVCMFGALLVLIGICATVFHKFRAKNPARTATHGAGSLP